jgi:hypothetical protein
MSYADADLHRWVKREATAALAARNGLSRRLLAAEFDPVPQHELLFRSRPYWLLEGRNTLARFSWDEERGLLPLENHPEWTPEFETRFRIRLLLN